MMAESFQVEENEDSHDFLGYTVQEMHFGILTSYSHPEYAQALAATVGDLCPDRFRVTILQQQGRGGDDDWPVVQVLVLGCLKPNFPHEQAQRYMEKHKQSSVLVLTDLDLHRNCADRRTFYRVLSAGGLQSFLPRHAFVNRDGYANGGDEEYAAADNLEIFDRRDQLEINGKILLKPVLERPVDPSDLGVRVYYPRSQGGGCKIITFAGRNTTIGTGGTTATKRMTAKFESNVRHIRDDDDSSSSFIYEELAETPTIQIRRRERKRDRIRTLVASHFHGATDDASFGDDDQVSFESDLSRLDRKIYVVTTASLPWRTGTAVNPLLRVAYLKRGRPSGSVTLVIPWLEKEADQVSVYGNKRFANPEEQETYVRSWLRDSACMPEERIRILESASYICKLIPDRDADFCILEEPEHLNWFRPEGEGEIWTEKFTHVVGVIHTNYRSYASQMSAGVIAAPIISGFSTLMVRAYCDKVIKLSGTLQTYSPEKEIVCNVHGVRSDFLLEGKRRAERPVVATEDNKAPAAYFIGKILWEKGLDHLLRLEYFFKDVTGEFFPIDIVGDGPDRQEVEAAYQGETKAAIVAKTIRRLLAFDSDDKQYVPGSQRNIAVEQAAVETTVTPLKTMFEIPKSMQLQTGKIPGRFHGRQDHSEFCSSYKVLVNPSVTEVLCTTVAEALAMGKFAVIPKHPSNEFFYQFPNCLAYENKVEFVQKMAFALSNEPEKMTEDFSRVFTWEAATERLIQSSAITMKEGRARAKAQKEGHDKHIAKTYNKLGLGAQRKLMRLFFHGAVSEPGDNAVAAEPSS